MSSLVHGFGFAAAMLIATSSIVPQNPRAPADQRYDAAMSLMFRGQDKEATTALEALLKDFPNHYKARLSLATFYYALGREPDARAQVDQLIRLHPRQSGPYTLLASIAEDKGDWAQAEGHLRKGTDVNPKDALVYEQLGTVLAIQKKYEAASVAYGQATALTPDWPQGHRANRDFFAALGASQKAGRSTDRVRMPVSGLTVPLAYGQQEFLVLAMRYTASDVIDEIRRVRPAAPAIVFWLTHEPKRGAVPETCGTLQGGKPIPEGAPFVAGGWHKNVLQYPVFNNPAFCYDLPDGMLFLRLQQPRSLSMKPDELKPLLVAISDAIRVKYGIR